MRGVVILLCLTAVAHADDASHNASCVGCHPQIGREWASSLHQHAWTDDVFQKAYAVEPVAFCRGCHAPTADPAAEPGPRAQAVGVGCVTCHGAGEHIVGPKPSPSALHAVTVDARMRTAAACASCHQFDFPADSHQLVPEPMQDTVAEHDASTAKSTPCQSCHMPSVDNDDGEGRHASHSFLVLSDPARIRQAVHVSARLDGSFAEVTLVAGKVGHAFPTGDMFRRVVVEVDSLDGAERILLHDSKNLERSFVDVTTGHGLQRMQAEDTRVPAPGLGARVVRLRTATAATTIRYRVIYQRMSTPMASAFGISQILDQIDVAHGDLPRPKLALLQGARP